MRNKLFATVMLMTLLATTQPAVAKEISDPFEDINRATSAFNKTIDTFFFRPLAKGYTHITPDFVEKGVHNFFINLFYPTTIINQLLQGNLTLAGQDTARFFINTTLGIGGLFDVASAGSDSLPRHQEDFGQTFGAWGVGNGPYIVIPVFGPSTVRDGFGLLAGIYTNPLTYVEEDKWKYGLWSLSILDARVDFFKKEELISGDEYLFVRDAYAQYREFLVKNGQAQEHDPFLDDE